MIIIISGHLRQGKGILATLLSLACIEVGYKVLSNYSIDSPMAKKIDFYDLIELLVKPRVEQKTLINIDEIYGWIESRASQSKANRFATYFAFQSAKLGYDLLCTSQITMRVDCSLRELADLRIRAEKDVENRLFNYYILDNKVTNEDVDTGQCFSIPFSVASVFWSKYNTFEGVTPIGLSELLVELQKYDVPRLNRTIDRQVSLLVQSGLRDTRRVAVESSLLELSEPTVYASIVAYRLSKRLRDIDTLKTQTGSPTIVEKGVQAQSLAWLGLMQKKGYLNR